MYKMKYLIFIITMLSIPGMTQLKKSLKPDGTDSVHQYETLNFNASATYPDSMIQTVKAVPENHQETNPDKDIFDLPEDEWFWFIGINIYPNELKIN